MEIASTQAVDALIGAEPDVLQQQQALSIVMPAVYIIDTRINLYAYSVFSSRREYYV